MDENKYLVKLDDAERSKLLRALSSSLVAFSRSANNPSPDFRSFKSDMEIAEKAYTLVSALVLFEGVSPRINAIANRLFNKNYGIMGSNYAKMIAGELRETTERFFWRKHE